MMQRGGLRKEKNIFNANKKLGEKKNELGKHKKNQKNERNKIKWMLVWIRSKKFMKINKPQSRNVTFKGTRTCPYGAKI